MPIVVVQPDGACRLPEESLRRQGSPQGMECWLDRRDGAIILLPRLPDLRKLYVEPTDHRRL